MIRQGAAAKPTGSSTHVGLAGVRILAVDDDADSLATFAILLQYEGAVVDTAADGEAALGLLAAKTYDLLISDVSMPGMNGLELVAEARRRPTGRRLVAVAVTGYGLDVDVRNALGAGFDAHVSKPFSMAQLLAKLDAL